MIAISKNAFAYWSDNICVLNLSTQTALQENMSYNLNSLFPKRCF